MEAYLPRGVLAAAATALFAGAAVAIGFAATRLRTLLSARALAWGSVLAGLPALDRTISDEPAGFRMLGLCAFGLLAMKGVVGVESRVRLGVGRWLGFSVLWVGMRPDLFDGRASGPLPGARDLLWRGAFFFVAGSFLVLAARGALSLSGSHLLSTVLLLPGLSLVLHFGILNVMAGAWRSRGIACDTLFPAPLRSESLTEFWGRRWNLAFSEMSAIAVYHPLTPHTGRTAAKAAAFLFSGLLHEMAISLPVQAGFGLPMTYFILHGGLVLVERSLHRRGRGLSGAAGRAWTLFWLAAPLPLLFHVPFLRGVLWPILGMPDGG
jgi:alginate O-acetyltransferase complex protein AlgI